jgi:CBS domain containing-hemolysin-like protein
LTVICDSDTPNSNHHPMQDYRPPLARHTSRLVPMLFLIAVCFAPTHAHASFLSGEALDTMANILSWVVIFIVPIVAITAFWLVHILPEKIAEKKKHPQAKAIQCLCLLSLFFGGLLWPLAWLWAYSKPVLHKLAYGTDVDESHGHEPAGEESEIETLRARVAELESQITPKEGKA